MSVWTKSYKLTQVLATLIRTAEYNADPHWTDYTDMTDVNLDFYIPAIPSITRNETNSQDS